MPTDLNYTRRTKHATLSTATFLQEGILEMCLYASIEASLLEDLKSVLHSP